MLPHLGETRSRLAADHLLQTPDTFIRTPLPGAEGVTFIVHASPRMGSAFTMMTAEFSPSGKLARPEPRVQRFLYVLSGELSVSGSQPDRFLSAGSFAYLPHNTQHLLQARSLARAVIIEKSYIEPDTPGPVMSALIGQETEQPIEFLGDDPGLRVRRLMPDGVGWDFAVNTMTYDPGASLAMVEVHVMEHGLLMLEGGGIYRLGEHWYPVTAGDFIWMAPYCPQWFGALGKAPAKYLIYKDWFRHPLAE